MPKYNKRNLFIIFAALAVLALAIYFYFNKEKKDYTPKAQPVRVSEAIIKDIPRYLPGLGTVTPLQDTVVKSRVDGYLMAIHFKEGQEVKAGDLLVEIDPRPFEVQLKQAQGALARDEALLKNARLDLERYEKLLRQDAIPEQQVQAQKAQVGQYEGTVQQDRAAIADAQLQLTYSRVTAPISGVAGLRQLDVGATVKSTDTAGIVRITQSKPCYVAFTLVDKYLPDVRAAMRKAKEELKLGKEELSIEISENSELPNSNKENNSQKELKQINDNGKTPKQAYAKDSQKFLKESEEDSIALGIIAEVWSQDGKTLLATGYLSSIDNQIDISTGTVKAKAIVRNEDEALFPNQFVNVRLLVETIENALVIPTAAIQRGSEGFFVYKVLENKAQPEKITVSYSDDELSVITEGLAKGDLVVTDGVDRLRAGTQVRF